MENKKRLATVSEAAQRFYREHLHCNYNMSGGWGDEGYDLIKELDKAGLIMVTLVYLDHDSLDIAG